MIEIIPAIIGQNFTEVINRLRLLEGVASWIHLDIMDHTLTDNGSWRTPEDLLAIDGKLKLEAHLMIREPELVLREWGMVVDRVVIQAEGTEHWPEILDFRASPVEVVPAFGLSSKLDAYDSVIKQVKTVQLMAIAEIGEQNHPFEEEIFERIAFLQRQYPNAKIQVDGGVNLENASRLIEAGVSRLIIGSAIWQSDDPLATLRKFQSLSK